ncbi:Uncharacterised protein [Bacillus freudenreichii]|nr:Uncharacterised protein [Bacillus freudenreichii]
MDKWREFYLIAITSILLVLILYLFKSYVPSVNLGKERPVMNMRTMEVKNKCL